MQAVLKLLAVQILQEWSSMQDYIQWKVFEWPVSSAQGTASTPTGFQLHKMSSNRVKHEHTSHITDQRKMASETMHLHNALLVSCRWAEIDTGSLRSA